MELLNVLRVLMHHRIAVALGAVAAVAVGAVASGALSAGSPERSPAARGEALIRVLIDTPQSLMATTVVKGAQTVHPRSFLLANLLAGDQLTAAVEREAGLRPGDLVILGPATTEPPVTPGLPERAAEAATVAALIEQEHALTVAIDPSVPIMSIRAAAPDAASARELAGAAVAALQATTAETGGKGGGVEVEPLGSVLSRSVATQTARNFIGGVAAVIAFIFWCAAIVVLGGLTRLWRRLGAQTAPST